MRKRVKFGGQLLGWEGAGGVEGGGPGERRGRRRHEENSAEYVARMGRRVVPPRTGIAGAARRLEARAAPTGLDFIWKESGPRRGSHMSSSSSELVSYRQPW